MGRCETCGNQYDKTFTVITTFKTEHTFDCFECAIEALAPRCTQCGVRVIGHGVETPGLIFCSAHCASVYGEKELRDRKLGVSKFIFTSL